MALANRSNVNSSIPFQRVHQRPRRPSMAAIVVDDTKLNRSCSPTVFTKVAARPHFDARSPKEVYINSTDIDSKKIIHTKLFILFAQKIASKEY